MLQSVHIMQLIFEWDHHKARINRRKHRITFDDAQTIFDDPLVITYPDEFHSDNEERSISIGTSQRSRLLLVVHTEQEVIESDDESGTVYLLIRIISSRKATATERKTYED